MQSLTAKIPNNEKLLDLDSFDLAFLAATNHIHFVDTNDILFKTATDLEKAADFKAVTLWGPEVELASKVFVRAWKEQSGKKLQDIRSAFDVSGDITVNAKKVKSILKKTQKDGEKVWKKIGPAILQALATAAERADRHFERQMKRSRRKKELNEAGWITFVSEATGDHVATFTKTYPGRVLHSEVVRLIDLVETDPAARLIDKAELTNRIKKIDQMPARYFNNVSDVHVGRCWNYTGLQAAKEQSVTRYIVRAKKDRITCPVCFRMDGKTFDVDSAHGLMTKFLNAAGKGKTPKELAKITPFPRVKVIDNLSPKQIAKSGWLVPFHNHCRCSIQFLWKRKVAR